MTIPAKYENGILRPLEEVTIWDSAMVEVAHARWRRPES